MCPQSFDKIFLRYLKFIPQMEKQQHFHHLINFFHVTHDQMTRSLISSFVYKHSLNITFKWKR